MNDKIQLAAMGEHMAEQAAQPMCMAKRIEELEAQVLVMAELLREAKGFVVQVFDSDINYWSDNPLLLNIDAVLACEMPSHADQPLAMVPEGWQLVPVVPEGWKLEALDNDCIVVRKDGVGFYVASFNAENIASTILHALASDMLAAATKPEPSP